MIHEPDTKQEQASEEEHMSRELVAAYSQQDLNAPTMSQATLEPSPAAMTMSLELPFAEPVWQPPSEVRLNTPLPKGVEAASSEGTIASPENLALPFSQQDQPSIDLNTRVHAETPIAMEYKDPSSREGVPSDREANVPSAEASVEAKSNAEAKQVEVVTETTLEDDSEEDVVIGEALTRYLHQRDKLPSADWTLELFQQICQSMQPFHDRELFHLQLATEKVKVLEVPQVTKIKDLETEAKDKKPKKDKGKEASADESTEAASEEPTETSVYFAPEVQSGDEVDARADVYSLGAIFYEMLTGNNVADPISFASEDERFKEHEWTNLQGVLTQALSDDPEERFESVEDFWDAILDARRHPDEDPPGVMKTATSKMKKKMSKHVRKFVTKQAQKRAGGMMMGGGGGGGAMGMGGGSIADDIIQIMVKEMLGNAIKSGSTAVNGAIDKKVTAAKTKKDSFRKRAMGFLKKSLLIVSMMAAMMVAGSVKTMKIFNAPPANAKQGQMDKQVKYVTKVVNGKTIKVKVKRAKVRKKPMTVRMWRMFQSYVNPDHNKKRKRYLPPKKELLKPFQDRQFPL